MRALLVALAALALAAPFAYAHASIKSMSPRPNTTVPKAISAVSVTFKSGIAGGNITVKNSKGKTVSIGEGSLSSDDRVLRVSLRSRLKRGRYVAKARWVAMDGHPNTKKWKFKLR